MKCQLCEKRAVWTVFEGRQGDTVAVCEKCYHYLWTLEGPEPQFEPHYPETSQATGRKVTK